MSSNYPPNNKTSNKSNNPDNIHTPIYRRYTATHTSPIVYHTSSPTSPTSQTSPICFTHLVEKSNEFIDKFHALTQIDTKNQLKVGIYKNRLYVCWNFLESLQRKINGDSRENLIIFLEENIIRYKHFFFKLIDLLTKDDATPYLINIIQEHRKLWPKWICGLNTLMFIYTDDPEFIERLKKNVLNVFNIIYASKVNY